MAESIVSPGVFTRENDLSFLPAGIGAIGAAIVGPTVKGPAFVPTVIRQGFKEFETKFGNQSPTTYVPFAVKEYLRNAGTVTVVRVLAGGGWKQGLTQKIITVVDTDNKEIVAIITPSLGNNVTDGLNSCLVNDVTALHSFTFNKETNFSLKLDGTAITETDVSMSFNPSANNYAGKVLGTSPANSKSGANIYGGIPAHLDISFKNLGLGTSLTSSLRITDGAAASVTEHVFTSSYAEGYDHASTPYITSGYQDVAGTTTDLFKFHTLADGTSTNQDYKISITNQSEPGDIDGEEQYSTFTVQIRAFGDSDKRPVIIEQFNNCDLNPDSVNFISRLIGDRYAAYDTNFGKVVTYGDYPNISGLIRVEVTSGVSEGSLSPKITPRGFAAVINPYKNVNSNVEGSDNEYLFPAYQIATGSFINGVYNPKGYLGWDFSELDNKNWNKPTAEGASANKFGKFNVDVYNMNAASSATYAGSLSASIDPMGANGPRGRDLQFSVPFQGGSDGLHPATVQKVGEYITSNNLYGWDISSTTAGGYVAYKKALDILSNQDEYDINMLALPGVIKQYHGSLTDSAIQMVEGRGDTFYVMDLVGVDQKVAKAVSEADGLDSNYAAVYYPWVKVLDTSRNKPVFVPPSVIVPGAIAASDRIGAEWFAPAGLNRGVLGTVIEAKNRLNQSERDQLYEGRVNPIATFPQTGVCIWGQKTLQVRPTALDRINVRRLMIAVKKFIASSSKYLVFEQNTIQTRNRFLNIANPYLESIQQRQGLYAFRVTMDETNNTPDEIDRNRLIGAIYLQPAKTAEFIILDFNILPTGATFDS